MPHYRFINRYYLMWTFFFCLICGICMIINGSEAWQTQILEEALEKTKQWQLNIGIFITLLVFIGAVSFEAGSKSLSWLYVFSTLALTLVAFVHAYIDLGEEHEAFDRTERLLKHYFKDIDNDKFNEKNYPKVNNFQRRMRCCGLNDKNEMMRGKECHYVSSCCHWKVKNCTDEFVYNDNCFSKAHHVIRLLRLCAALGIISGIMQLSVLIVLFIGAVKYIYNLIFPPEGPIISE